GYLLYDEVNDILPAEVHSSEEIDDLLSTFERYGIDVYEDLSTAKAALAAADADGGAEPPKDDTPIAAASEDGDLDLTPGTLEKTNDPVRMYLREMGTVPLLTREGEVEIARRIERGQLRVMKAISRSPVVIREIVALGEDLKRGVRNIKEVVIFDDEELTEEVVQTRVRATVTKTDTLVKHQKKAQQLEEKLEGGNQKAKPREHRRLRWSIA